MTETVYPEDTRARVDSCICGCCRKPITLGHRVVQAWIAEGRGMNPKNLGEVGLRMTGEYEFVHVDCHDPYLKRGARP